MYDEKNWKGKPWFQLASMAQTRAGAKALRNLLARVVVLAGYNPTPAEEMDDMATTTVTNTSPYPPKPIGSTITRPDKCLKCGAVGKYHAKGCPNREEVE